ncbi:MAG: HNH endonuclease family protein [Candidatus Saccharibacteria bacterium]|nr:HNH endonuclease family protein [Candidatus Saccharibacteria bacterium]
MKFMGGTPVYRRRRFLAVAAVAFIFVSVAAYDTVRLHRPVTPLPGALSKHEVPRKQRTLAVEALGRLAVKNRVSSDDYSREQFGNGWAEGGGCDTRNRILRRDLQEVAVDDDNCTVLSGVLTHDPFTAREIPFKRGRATSGDIHIEHLVAVSDAWQKGAQELTARQRRDFYNDPLNLIATDSAANVEKGGADAAHWLPDRAYRCMYVARQIAVKQKYGLWVTQNERSAMERTLHNCPDQLLPIVNHSKET